ncbi:MAG: hypothetical protein ABGW97_15845 [Christiangramia sp.]|uniref:hypothetical protein n=1 Tax=Christiangramia sp. TaxID=1931228 RepID=UPI0032420F18
MQKIDKPFSNEDLELLRRSFTRIGEKHGTTGVYVGQIAAGKRAVKTEVAKAILADLKELLQILKPGSTK